MRPTTFSFAVVLSFLCARPGLVAAQGWQIDPDHSRASFSVRHMMMAEVRGDLGAIEGSVDYDEKDPARTKVDVTIDAAGLDTKHAERDENLRGPEFFDVGRHPKLRFRSKIIEKAGEIWKLKGDLTIRGVTKPVELTATVGKPAGDPWGRTVVGMQAWTKIDRRQFGLTWNKSLEAGGVLVGNDVDVFIDLELTR